jgi:hypothetical protein
MQAKKHLKKSLKKLETIVLKRPTYSNRFTYDELIEAESRLGSTLFGPVPLGHERKFFAHKKNVWIWHEDGRTIRYEVRQNGVFKKVDESGYHKVTGEELEHFRKAASAYLALVKSRIYK